MIQISGIHKSFGSLEALKNVSLEFHSGECIALLGPNGCGKTTLIKSILGMVMPNLGEIYVNQKNIRKSYEYRETIGYMPQIGRYPDNMTIGQIIQMITNIRGGNLTRDEELLSAYFTPDMFNKRMSTLSGGTTQKVSASLAFLFRPDILILDEPTAGLDPVAAEILKDKMLKEKEMGKLILITSHMLSELDDLITHVVFMQEGEVKIHESVEDLKKQTGETRISRAISQVLKGK